MTKSVIEAPLIYVGASPLAIAEARASINEILAAPHVEDKTKREAIRALKDLCAIQANFSNITVSRGSNHE